MSSKTSMLIDFGEERCPVCGSQLNPFDLICMYCATNPNGQGENLYHKCLCCESNIFVVQTICGACEQELILDIGSNYESGTD